MNGRGVVCYDWMQALNDSKDRLHETRNLLRETWSRAFQVNDLGQGEEAWDALEVAFAGNHPKFEAIDAPYHDLDHTLKASACYVELAVKNLQTNDYQPLPLGIAELGLIAILFHDSGYLKDKGDLSGTGAKYAFDHVGRSQAFAKMWLLENGFDDDSILEIQSMIQCTDFSARTLPITFASNSHRLAGHMVGTADLLGQMASHDYIRKLPLLHQEMIEALNHNQSAKIPVEIPQTPQELLKMTPDFFNNYVIPKLTNEYENVFKLLNQPYPDGPNRYMRQIQEHIDSINQDSNKA